MTVTTTALDAPQAIRRSFPGLVVAALCALGAGWIAGGLGEPLSRNPVLIAMLLGLFLGNCFTTPEALFPGLNFTKRYLLRLAVILIGFRITLNLLLDLGITPLLIALFELISVLYLVYLVGRKVLRLEPEVALLTAIGCAVCGAAAILSASAILRSRDRSAGIAIVLITLAGTVSLLVYPVLFLAGWLPQLDDRTFGIFVGASIFELAQVYGASYAVSEGALNTATLVKLTKVLMLIPLLLLISVVVRRKVGAGGMPIPVPWFVLGFATVVLLNSHITLDPQIRGPLLDFDQFLFMMVMAALGLTTRLTRLGEIGEVWRLLAIGSFSVVISAAITYVALGSLSTKGATLASPATESRMLAVPGGRLFSNIGCSKCHVPALLGRHGEIPLYSDLLLHDMGGALDDKIVQGNAIGSEWRTTPLIELHSRTRYLHDNRAESLPDAIFAHGGEAKIVRDRFFALDEVERHAILEFVGKL